MGGSEVSEGAAARMVSKKIKHKQDLIDLMLQSPGSPLTLAKTPTFRRAYGWWDLSEVYQQLRDVLHSFLAALVRDKRTQGSSWLDAQEIEGQAGNNAHLLSEMKPRIAETQT